MHIQEAYKILANLYATPIDEFKSILNKHFGEKNNATTTRNLDIILPFCGVINDDCCKAILYNHGLLTQCTNKCSEKFCSPKCKSSKYGVIYDRLNCKKGEFVTKNGKREILYEDFMKKNSYNYDDVIENLRENNLTYELPKVERSVKKGRGRPRKTESTENDIKIDVSIIFINGVKYYKTENNTILEPVTNAIIGTYKTGEIIYKK